MTASATGPTPPRSPQPARRNVAAPGGLHPATGPTGSAWQVRPAPTREPGFDEHRPRRHLSLVGASANELPFQVEPPLTRPVEDRDPFAVQLTRRQDLPAVDRFGRQLFTGLLEVLAGRRPAAQLAALTSAGVHAGISRDARRGNRLGDTDLLPVLQSMRVSEPVDGVAELSAVVRIGPRCRAIAARVEGLDGRWRCVRLQIG